MAKDLVTWRLWRITLTRWLDTRKAKSWNTSITFGPFLSLHLCRSASNSHGTQPKGHPWNQEMVTGWKLVKIEMQHGSVGKSLRWILYEPDGAWFHFDIYATLSRKHKDIESLRTEIHKRIKTAITNLRAIPKQFGAS